MPRAASGGGRQSIGVSLGSAQASSPVGMIGGSM